MENLNEIAGYAPIIIVVLMFFVQYRIFVTPEQLEKKHREILEDISKNYESSEPKTAKPIYEKSRKFNSADEIFKNGFNQFISPNNF